MNLRRFLIIFGVIGLSIIVVTTLGNPHKILAAFRQVHWYVVPLIIFTQAIDYYCNARYYQAFFNISGRRVPLRRLYEASLAINFANTAIPSGGVAGTTFLVESMHKYGISTGRTTLVQLGRYVFTFTSYFAVLFLGFVMLFIGGSLDHVSARFVVLFMVFVLALGLVLFTTFSERARLEKLMRPIIRVINVIGRRVLHRHEPLVSPTRVSGFLDEFYHGYREIMSHKHTWPALFRWTLLSNIAEVATVYAVFIGFGLWPNPGVVIAGYTLAIITSMTGIFINGLGVYEAGMIGTIVALGVPFALTFAIVTVYRILSMAIFLPIGFYFYRRHLRESS